MDSKNSANNQTLIYSSIIILLLIGGYLLLDKNSDGSKIQSDQSISNSQQEEINALKSEIEGLKTQQTRTERKQTNLSDIVQEWRKTTALVFCQYGYLGDYSYREVSGSGLLVSLNGVPQVITNSHVVSNSRNDLNSCWIKFPDQTGASTYTVSPQSITHDSGGYDVAYLNLSMYSQNDIHAKEGISSISNRARSDSYLCKNAPNVGDHILILGYPVYGTPISLSRLYSQNPIEVTATEGVISGKDGIYYTTSAKIDSGNSGGLAIDETNDCYFGIPTWNKSGNFESLGRILPASYIFK